MKEERMKAIVKERDGFDGWKIKELERREPKDDEIEIQVKAAGICGSELHLWHDNHYYTPGTVIGHEYSGQISRVGRNVSKWKAGDRVVTENRYTACGICEFCRNGNRAMCKSAVPVGYKSDGGWRKYTYVPATELIKIPDNVSFEEAAMTEPAAVITEALCVKEPVRAGETVLIQGCGTMGLLACMVAKNMGASKVIITGTDADVKLRLPLAEKIGADETVNVQREDLLAAVDRITAGNGVDYIAECSGAPGAVKSSLDAAKKLGRIVAIGESPAESIDFDWNKAVFKALTLKFHFGSDYNAWHIAVRMMENGSLNVKPLITHRISMADFRKGFGYLDDKEALKVIMYPFED